jgi:hypothetical protein
MRVAEELQRHHGALPAPARNLADIARVKALAAEVGATSVSVVRNRLQISPLSLDARQMGILGTLGGVYVERDRKAIVPLEYGALVTSAALGMLDAILTGVNSGPHASQEDE